MVSNIGSDLVSGVNINITAEITAVKQNRMDGSAGNSVICNVKKILTKLSLFL